MKEKKKRTLCNDTKGITLVALVVTIIVLLILAGVSLSAVFNDKGIFKKAEGAANKYDEAKARETLTLVLSEAQMKKYESGLEEAELDAEIKKIGSLLPKTDETSSIQQVIVGEYIFEIDKSVPKITDRGCIGKANEVIVTSTITQNGNWQNPTATVTGTITKLRRRNSNKRNSNKGSNSRWSSRNNNTNNRITNNGWKLHNSGHNNRYRNNNNNIR